ncbi:hypothetical protein CLU79DRAFT_552308 [Phycomyces nitens]|nr:hypothetical protein CLU79DRAFT_552308 [Phycomyces nitens]
MAQWQSRVASLRAQLKQHSIEEETIDNDSSWLLTASLKEDAEFIKDAHRKAMQPENNKTTNQLWNSIDTSTIALRQDIDSFQLWRSLAAVPIADLTKEESDRIGHAGVSSSLRKAFFGRSRSSKRTK